MVDRDASETGGGKPAIRAIQSRSFVAYASEHEPQSWSRIAAACDPAVVARARASFALAWFPMRDHMHLCEIAFDIVGEDCFRESFCNAFEASIQSPMLRGLFGMIRRMTGDPTAALARHAPRIYHHVTRDVGTMTARVDAHSAVLEIRGYPPPYRFEVWLSGTQACVMASLRAVDAGRDAEVTIEAADATRRRGAFRLRW